MSFTYHESCLETATIKKEEFLEVRKELLLERLRKKYRRFAPIVTSCGRLETYNHLIKPCPQCINRKVSYSWEKTLDIILNRKYVIPQDKKYAAMLRTMVKHGFGSLYTQCEYPTPKIAWQGMTRVIPFYDPCSNVMFDCFTSEREFDMAVKNYPKKAAQVCLSAGYNYCTCIANKGTIEVVRAPNRDMAIADALTRALAIPLMPK